MRAGVDQEEASHLLTTLDYRRAVAEIAQAARHLLACGSPRVGILGGCMGGARPSARITLCFAPQLLSATLVTGALAFAAAQHCTELSCAVPFYGTPAREMPWIDVTQIKIPVQYHTGMLDRITGFSDPASGTALLQHMAAAGCASEMHLYENTPHSFLNALVEGGVAFLEKWGYGVPPREQVQLAFDRAVYFLRTHLQPSAGVET